MCTVVPFFITACNSSSLCDNGFCMHDNWRCDGLNQCGDWSDEKYCNGSQPIPTTPAPPTPAPHAGGGGFSGGISLFLGNVYTQNFIWEVYDWIDKFRLMTISEEPLNIICDHKRNTVPPQMKILNTVVTTQKHFLACW